MYSKSLFGNNSYNITKTIINPVDIPFKNNEIYFTIEELSKIRKIDKNYTNPLANQNYEIIPNNLVEYLEIYNMLSQLQIHTQNNSIKLLLKITQHGLSGAIHAFGLNTANIEMNIQNILLQNKIEDILTSKNVNSSIDTTQNQYILHKTMTLAPLYSYYVALFGIPVNGKGFDQNKLSILLSVLEKNGIHPYFTN